MNTMSERRLLTPEDASADLATQDVGAALSGAETAGAMTGAGAGRALALPISVLILTRNEQRDIGDCLASVAWSDDVQVLDSCSTDATVAIARNRGAQVTERAFDGYSSQRNFGLHALAWRHDWLLILDADDWSVYAGNPARRLRALARRAPQSDGGAT